jgi:hypothetical protein
MGLQVMRDNKQGVHRESKLAVDRLKLNLQKIGRKKREWEKKVI